MAFASATWAAGGPDDEIGKNRSGSADRQAAKERQFRSADGATNRRLVRDMVPASAHRARSTSPKSAGSSAPVDLAPVRALTGGWLYVLGDVNHHALLIRQGKYQARIAGAVIAARAAGQPVDPAPRGPMPPPPTTTRCRRGSSAIPRPGRSGLAPTRPNAPNTASAWSASTSARRHLGRPVRRRLHRPRPHDRR